MKKRLLAFVLSAFLCLSLAVPALAADKTPDISITWLSVGGQPYFYNRDLNWLMTIDDLHSYDAVIDLETGKRINDYDYVESFFEGLAVVAKEDADGNWKCGYIDKTGAVVAPLEYDRAHPFSCLIYT
ncbi:MAG: WG repeat-containing protein [Dysosmobacter sp.]|nr:WG repeat-containing protein [Dysosmobacter sp.]